jgi:uncharacterized protein (DUF1330 family)
MAKGYWIVRGEVTDPAEYARYIEANAAPLKAHHARFLVRGGQFEAVEGNSRSRNVVLEFASYQAALDCYHSPAYQEALALRKDAADINLIIIEGYDGPQPGE